MVDLILDTDIGNDCDDAAAVALASSFAKEGKCNLLCVTVNTSDPFAPDCIDAIAEAYGSAVPVGVYRGEGFPANPKSYCRAVAERFGTVRGREREEAVCLLRKTLASAKGKTVAFVCIGQLNNLRALLESEADGLGPSGQELFAEKVKEVVVMGGMFGKKRVRFNGERYDREFNIATAVGDSVRALKLCPSEVVFSDFLLGVKVVTLAGRTYRGESDPVGYAYELFCGQGHGRPSWDILTVLYAVEGEGSAFRLTRHGRVHIDGEGRTAFRRDPAGAHRLLRARKGPRKLEKHIEALFGE